MTVWKTTAGSFAADHPSLAGHFPGNPIVPGTLILERVIDSLTDRHGERWVCEVVDTKFLSPLLPGQGFTIHFHEKAGLVSFECRLGESLISCGKLKLTQPEEPM